jgi:Holliday junction resolvase
MILTQNIYKSTKRIGKYEEKIIQTLTKHFQLEGYEVVPHSSLNIAWGTVLSDVDLLLIKDQMLTYVEVKSSRDNLSKAKQQIDRVMDYVDYAYVATDKHIKNWEFANVGLILIKDEEVALVKKGKKFHNKPRFYSVAILKKKCLARFFGTDSRYLMLVNKYELAEHIYTNRKCTRPVLKEIVTCGDLCTNNCPIRQAES